MHARTLTETTDCQEKRGAPLEQSVVFGNVVAVGSVGGVKWRDWAVLALDEGRGEERCISHTIGSILRNIPSRRRVGASTGVQVETKDGKKEEQSDEKDMGTSYQELGDLGHEPVNGRTHWCRHHRTHEKRSSMRKPELGAHDRPWSTWQLLLS